MSTPQPVVDISKTTSINPATGEIIGFSPINTPEEGRQAIIRARQAQKGWAALPLDERVKYVLRMRDYLIEHADEVSEVICKDVGKARVEGFATEVLPSVIAITYYTKNAKRFLKPRRIGGGALLFFNKSSTLYPCWPATRWYSRRPWKPRWWAARSRKWPRRPISPKACSPM
jgi:succinate-semialdehyde dehydrogenase/glutarate-semialdehyde dehydrogenase